MPRCCGDRDNAPVQSCCGDRREPRHTHRSGAAIATPGQFYRSDGDELAAAATAMSLPPSPPGRSEGRSGDEPASHPPPLPAEGRRRLPELLRPSLRHTTQAILATEDAIATRLATCSEALQRQR